MSSPPHTVVRPGFPATPQGSQPPEGLQDPGASVDMARFTDWESQACGVSGCKSRFLLSSLPELKGPELNVAPLSSLLPQAGTLQLSPPLVVPSGLSPRMPLHRAPPGPHCALGLLLPLPPGVLTLHTPGVAGNFTPSQLPTSPSYHPHSSGEWVLLRLGAPLRWKSSSGAW